MASQPIALRLRTTAPRALRGILAGPPPQARPRETVAEALDTAIECWTRKAQWNKRAARRGTRAIVLSSAAIPVVLLVSVEIEGMQVGQVLAGLLAAISTAAAAFLQFNRPYADWRLYREYQRCGERERFMYDTGLAPYDKDAMQNERLLAQRLVELQRRLELKWAALQPEDGDVSRVSAQRR
jgi:Protein of unknown function (DUF4231)